MAVHVELLTSDPEQVALVEAYMQAQGLFHTPNMPEADYSDTLSLDLGTIEPSKIADLIVLNSNPLDDIHHTTDILYVMKGGRLWDGNTVDEIWPQKKAFGENYWNDRDALRSDERPTDYWDHHK